MVKATSQKSYFRAALLAALSLFTSALFAADKPNFVWLISEDNSTHYLKLFDEHGAETPRIAELAKHGLLFEHAFSNSPVCSVARTTLMTSCYGPRIGTQFHRRSVMVPMPPGLRMFPAYLRDAGYYTTNNKKKDYNAIEGDGVWDESSPKATWQNRSDDQPFFHMQSFGATHESSLHFKDMSKPTKHDPETVFVAPYHPNTPTFRYTNARYRDNIQTVDQQIGAVVDQLEADGLLEDTFIFYFGDHGGVLPRGKGYAYESGLHVPLVIRVPEKWKHLTQDATLGSRQKGFVSFIDFGPTLLNLAGVDVPAEVDGKPFLGDGISMTEVSNRDEAFGYADRFDEKMDLVRTLRKGKYEYVRSYQPFNFDGLQNNYRYRMLAFQEWRELYQAGKLNDVQKQFFETRPAEALYDIEADPHETKNLATVPAYAPIVQEMRQRLRDRIKGMPDLSMYPEAHLADAAFQNPVPFGQEHKQDIARLVDIADLSLVSFYQAEDGIKRALDATDPWQRYWALITCTVHGDSAKPLTEKIKHLAEHDEVNLVRLRAAEFLALTGSMNTRDIVLDCLDKAKHGVEANMVMNTLVLLRDGSTGYQFTVPASFEKPKPGMAETTRRLLYLNDDVPKW